MKPIVALVLLLLLAPLAAQADTHIVRESHTDGYYSGGRITPPDDSTIEMWIGEKRMAYVARTSKVVIDLEKQRMLVMNLRDESYAETPLPVDMAVLLTEEDHARIAPYQRQGTVSATEGTRILDEKECKGWEIEDWIVYQGARYNEREVRAWTTADVPFDMAEFETMFVSLAALNNLSAEYTRQILAVGGFQVATEEVWYDEAQPVRTTTRVVEMKVMDPPAGIYAVPEGFTKKDKLSLQDLQG